MTPDEEAAAVAIGKVTPDEKAAHGSIPGAAATSRLVRMGLLELVDHPTYRPGKLARLTDRGRDLLARWKSGGGES